MTVLACITDPEVVRKILAHLKLPTCPPPLARARRTAEPLGFELGEECLSATAGVEAGEDPDAGEISGRSPP
jgi:hypothetical protein